MAAYVIGEVEVTNPVEYEEYRRQVPATVEKYGGRFNVRGGRFEVFEGDWEPHRVVMLEFPSFEQAKQWYHSPEYQKIVPLRQRNSRTGFLFVVEGIQQQ